MPDQEVSDYDLLTEHLSYPPVALLDDIINTVNVLADRALDSVERLLLSIPPSNLGFTKHRDGASATPEEAAKLEIENGTHQLETLLNASIDKNFDIFELYAMRNILTVSPADRPHVKLAHYEGLDLEAASRPDAPTEGGVTNLRRRLHASLRLHVRLEEERAKNEALLAKLRTAMGVPGGGDPGMVKSESAGEGGSGSAFGFLRDKAGLEQGGADKPLTTTTQFALSQLQALRSLSQSLRTIMPDITPDEETSTSNDNEGGASGSWRRERVEYVEGASRKYLENTAGLELGPQGEVRDGEWQGDGRQLSKGEVEGLEKVVTILERSGGGGGGSSERQAAGRTAEPTEDDNMDES